MLEQQGMPTPRIALLIDFDNVILGVDEPPGFDAELVMNALRSRGVVVLGRAYGDWHRHNRHRRKLMEQGIELVETPAFGPVIKNSADICIALDAFEIGMTQSHITEFCLVSGDSDFLPLIKRLQLLGKSVTVIAGNKFTSELIRRNCNEYISYENLLAESVGASEDATTMTGAFALLQRTISTMDERGQDTRSSSVKQMMLQLNPVFSERSFGCSQFKQFLDKACQASIIRLGRRDGNSGEYQVMLLDENGQNEHTPASEPTPKNTPKPLISDLETAPVSRSKKTSRPARSSSKPASDQEPQPQTPESSEPTSIEDDITKNASTISTQRKGRLRFSGRTWRSSGTSTETAIVTKKETVDETPAENSSEGKAEDPIEEQVETSPEEKSAAVAPQEAETESTSDKDTDSTVEEAANKPEIAETEEAAAKPKARTRRKSPTADEDAPAKPKAKAKPKPKSTKTTKAADAKKKLKAETSEPTAKKAEKDSAEADEQKEQPAKKEVKPKKAPVRRRTSSRTTKKTEEATETPAEPDVS